MGVVLKYAVISDIHANLEALTAVLQRIDTLAVDKIVVCGDLVGYHSNPNECVDLLRERNVIAVRGNHDVAAAGVRDMIAWEVAVKAIDWTRLQLSQINRHYLESLPAKRVVDNKFILFHGALHPTENGEDLHLTRHEDIALTLEALAGHDSGVRLGFYGHTHRREIHRYRAETETLRPEKFTLEPGYYYIVNPGSVGQPRDGTTEASFLIYDEGSQQIHYESVAYDRKACLDKARRQGLLRNPYQHQYKRLKKRTRNAARKVIAYVAARIN